ncbi:MAG: diguanylate cyclase [Proteobacteria bacterium]|nr:diguanylate cyclase [Pseudomonadota bacterium]
MNTDQQTDARQPGMMHDVTVLYVDGEPVAREQAVAILSRMVTDVVVAESVDQALECMRETSVDIVITDILAPALDGVRLIGEVRRMAPDVPVLLACGVEDTALLLKAAEQDADRLLLKPLLPDVLVLALASIVRSVELRRRLEAADGAVHLMMDTSPHFALLAEDGTIAYVNQGMLAFLGLSTYTDFVRSGACVGDYISELDGVPWKGGDDWIRSVIEDPLDRERMLTIPNLRDPARRLSSFMVAFKEFPTPGRYLVTLTDVTELEDEKRALQDEASTDPLTGAFNRRRLLDLLAELEKTSTHGSSKYSLIMLDVDHFKHVNDEWGHDVGDVVLKELTKLVQNNVRSSDILARWGGEEFMVLTPDSDHRRATRVAERLRRKVEGCDFPGVPHVISASFGVAQATRGESSSSLLKRVDEALYQAKNLGRNRVVLSSPG